MEYGRQSGGAILTSYLLGVRNRFASISDESLRGELRRRSKSERTVVIRPSQRMRQQALVSSARRSLALSLRALALIDFPSVAPIISG